MMKQSLSLLVLIILFSCKEDKKEETTIIEEVSTHNVVKLSSKRPNLNISILLDLSDRINPEKYPNSAMEYFERDLGYIHSIVESFEFHLRNKRSIKINDHIQLYIDPEPADKSINEKIMSLNLTFTKDNAKKSYIENTSNLYDSISRQIYHSAIKDNNYVGSNIWGFFKSNVRDFCIEENHRNILIVLTDGYLYHKESIIKEGNLTSYLRPQDIRRFKLTKSDWKEKIQSKKYGFLSTQNDLKDLEIMVLGVNPDPKNPYEQDVIIEYWSNWLKKMNVKNYEIKTALLPANMNEIIREHILNE